MKGNANAFPFLFFLRGIKPGLDNRFFDRIVIFYTTVYSLEEAIINENITGLFIGKPNSKKSIN
jgi:hypothetical protein